MRTSPKPSLGFSRHCIKSCLLRPLRHAAPCRIAHVCARETARIAPHASDSSSTTRGCASAGAPLVASNCRLEPSFVALAAVGTTADANPSMQTLEVSSFPTCSDQYCVSPSALIPRSGGIVRPPLLQELSHSSTTEALRPLSLRSARVRPNAGSASAIRIVNS